MASYKFGVTGQDRKKLVGAISEILDTPMNYLGAPTFAYEIGDYRVEKDGTVTGEYSLNLMAALGQKGFAYETEPTFHLITPRGTFLISDHFATAEEADAAGYGNYFHHEGRDVYIKTNPEGTTEHSKRFAVVGAAFATEAPVEEPPKQDAPQDETLHVAATAAEEADRVSIEYPLEGFTPEALDNLTKMVLAKEPLLKKALGTEELPIQIETDRICFPWFRLRDENGSVAAYSQFIAALCEAAKTKKRVTAKAPDGAFENEAFTMRVWLVGLGLVGSEYSACRKLMGHGLSGDSAWRYGKPKKEAIGSDNQK